MHYRYDYNGVTYSVRLERQPDGTLKATVGEREYSLSAAQLGDGIWQLELEGSRMVGHSATDKEARYVHLNGTHYRLEKVAGRRQKRKGSAGSGDLTADMPGQVLEIRVAAGDTVTGGQVLMVLEAMKMEIRITAPAAGTVSKVLVKVGDVVDRGQRLAEVAAD